MLLAVIIRQLTTHPFRDGAPGEGGRGVNNASRKDDQKRGGFGWGSGYIVRGGNGLVSDVKPRPVY